MSFIVVVLLCHTILDGQERNAGNLGEVVQTITQEYSNRQEHLWHSQKSQRPHHMVQQNLILPCAPRSSEATCSIQEQPAIPAISTLSHQRCGNAGLWTAAKCQAG